MSVEAQVRELIEKATAAHPTTLDVLFHEEGSAAADAAIADTRFVDFLGAAVPALAEGLVLVAREVDALRGATGTSD